jgi:Zn finger protein HypA/HybF involved in hydrogenase expression
MSMHETHIFKNMTRYFEDEEKTSSKRIKKVHVALSEFGGFKEAHFLEHWKEAFCGTKWDSVELDIKKVPYGAEFEITKLEFV